MQGKVVYVRDYIFRKVEDVFLRAVSRKKFCFGLSQLLTPLIT
jgi:hypothetical protein